LRIENISEKFRLAVVGIDHPHGQIYRELLKQMWEADVVAFNAHGETERQMLQEPFASRPVYTSISKMLAEEDFEGALVLLPNNEAPKVCIELADAGKHVMAEKPVARNGREMRAVVEAVNRNRVKFAGGYAWRFDPIAMDIRRFIQEGVLGKIYSVETKMITSFVGGPQPPHRNIDHYLFKKDISGGGFFNWLAVHWIDLLLFFLDSEVVSVAAIVDNVAGKPIDVEDGGVAVMRFANGALVSLHCGYYIPEGYENSFNIHGSQGWVRWEPFKPDLHVFSTAQEWTAAPERRSSYSLKALYGLDFLRDWMTAIREDRQTVNTAENALRVLEIVDAIYESSVKGRRIDIRI